jgi:DNA-binding PadR family transcriptional regulator
MRMPDNSWSDTFGFGFGDWANQKGRRFRWRIFERGDLKFVILRLIYDKPMHGYEVMQALEEESAGCYKASAGSVYPTLQMLEDEGYIQAEEKGGKKVYEITAEGKEYLDENGDMVDEIFERISSFANRFVGKDTRALSTAFSRLAQTTFEGAFAFESGPELIRKMADVIENARLEMENIRKGHEEPVREKEVEEDVQEVDSDVE